MMNCEFLKTFARIFACVGGNFTLKYSAQSSKEAIHFGTIIAYIGLRYKNYCSNTVRTMFVNPSDEQREIYDTVYEAHEHALSKLVAGAKLNSVYTSVKTKLQGRDRNNHQFSALTGPRGVFTRISLSRLFDIAP